MKPTVSGVIKTFAIVGALAVLVALLDMSFSMYTPFTPVTRARGCSSNQNSLDKAMGVWESEHAATPLDRDLWVEFRSDGTIARLSPDMEAWHAGLKVPPARPLKAGSKAIYDYLKDLNVFCCPSRYNVLPGDALVKAPEIHYRWISGPAPRKELNGRRRGTICIFYGEVGPTDDPLAVHR